MTKFLHRARFFIARQKLYIDRGRGWWSLPQYLVQGITMIAALGYGDWIKHHPFLSAIIGMGMVLFGLAFTGLIENRLGIVQAEYGRVSDLSPVYQRIFSKFEDLSQQNEALHAHIRRLEEQMAQYAATANPPDHRVDIILDQHSHNHRPQPGAGPMPLDSTGGRLNPDIQ